LFTPDAADLEDRYERRLRAMIDAKLKGEGIDLEAKEPVASTSLHFPAEREVHNRAVSILR
jgi:non-homologous end joining protein Ku